MSDLNKKRGMSVEYAKMQREVFDRVRKILPKSKPDVIFDITDAVMKIASDFRTKPTTH